MKSNEMSVVVVTILLLGCNVYYCDKCDRSDIPIVVKEEYKRLRKLADEEYRQVDMSECIDKYPDYYAPHGLINGAIYESKLVIDSAGYKIIWDCEKGGYTLSKKEN